MSADVLVADTRPVRYEKFMDGFKAEQIVAKLSGELDAGLNACIECCDRHGLRWSDRFGQLWPSDKLESCRGCWLWGCGHRVSDVHHIHGAV